MLIQDERILKPLFTECFVEALICGENAPRCILERLSGHRLLVGVTRSVVI